MSPLMMQGLIIYFLIGTVVAAIKQDLPMVCYFAGAAMLNLGVLIK